MLGQIMLDGRAVHKTYHILASGRAESVFLRTGTWLDIMCMEQIHVRREERPETAFAHC
jgi:hypothetical protein